jgi:hypothetical protein
MARYLAADATMVAILHVQILAVAVVILDAIQVAVDLSSWQLQ